MFDWPLDWIALLVAIAALIFARKASNRVTELQARLDHLEAAREAGFAAPAPMPPPLMPLQEVEATLAPAAPEPAAELRPGDEPDTIIPASDVPLAAAASTPDDATAPPPPPPLPVEPSFEERIGTRWVVWVGGLTLALGGFFLVRYSIDAGLIGPEVRVTLGGLFALALLALGEWSRRKESISQIAALPIANIPAMLTAAGTAVAFATVYAAYALYDFLGPASAFILLGIVALGTLAAALLHGPALAGLGIAAAFVTPVLVSSGEPNYWALYIYLAVVTAAAFTLARLRLWRWLAVTTIVLAFLWTLPCLDCGLPMVAPHSFHVIAGFGLAALIVVCGFMFGPDAADDKIEPVSSASLAVYLLGAMLIVLASFHDDLALTVFAILIASSLVVAWRAPAATGVVGAAALMLFIVFAEWAVRGNPDMLVLPGGALPGMGPSPTGESVTSHLVTAAIFAGSFGLAGFLAQGRSSNAVVPVVWSGAGVFTPLALLVALYARIAHLDRSIPFAILAVLLAAAFGAATEALTRREDRPGLAVSTALFATGTLGALALALTFALDKGWLTIALALTSLGTAWIVQQRPIPFLRTLAAILAGIVVARIGYDPRIVGDAVGTTPIFNWLLWGYGVPALSFWGASYLLRKQGEDAPLGAVEAAAILFTVLLGVPGDPPRRQWRRHAGGAVAGRSRPRRLRRAGHGDRAGAAAAAQRQPGSQCRRRAADDLSGADRRTRAVDSRESHAVSCRAPGQRHQPAAARLCVSGGADAAVVLRSRRPPQRDLCQHPRRRRAGVCAGLCDAGNPAALSRSGSARGNDRQRRAVQLFDRLARLRRDPARHRHLPAVGARAPRLGAGHRTHDPEGIPGRHVDLDRRLSRTVVHLPRPGAGGDRLALSEDPVSPAAIAGGCRDAFVTVSALF